MALKNEAKEGVTHVGDQPPAKKDETPAAKAEEKTYAGKFKTDTDLEKGYLDLEKGYGNQADEIGRLRGEVGDLTSKLVTLAENMAQGKQEPPADQPNYDEEFTGIQAKVTSGDMTFAEALAETRRITTAEVMGQAQAAMAEMSAERDAEQAKNAFLDKHQDYEEIAKSGALDPILEENPMFDTFTAYFVYKANQALSDRETAVNEAFEKGKAEQAKAEEGVKTTQTVLDSSGAEIAQTSKTGKPLTDSQMEDSMMASIKNLRANQT